MSTTKNDRRASRRAAPRCSVAAVMIRATCLYPHDWPIYFKDGVQLIPLTKRNVDGCWKFYFRKPNEKGQVSE